MLYRESSLNVIDIAYVCDLEYVLAYWILSLSLSLSLHFIEIGILIYRYSICLCFEYLCFTLSTL